MRTKTLIMTAALSAAGVATSMAQVYSVNAVGYVNTTLKAGFNLISNPLRAANNSISALFGNSLPPVTSKVYTFTPGTGGGFTIYTYLGSGNWSPATTAVNVNPGDGVFVKIAGADVNITFVGEVDQGTGTALDNPIPAGLSIKSSRVPQSGTLDTDLGFPIASGDKIFKWDNATQGYTIYKYLGTTWVAPGRPSVNVGEAVFVSKVAATTWSRNFTVSP